jgi:hypothetical protein
MILKFAFISDTATISSDGKLSAIGIFDIIGSVSYPMKHRDMSLVLSIEGTQSEKGTRKISIEFRDEDDNRILEAIQNIELGNNALTHGNLRAQMLLRLQDLPFGKPGQYQFVIFGDDRFMGRVIITAQKIEVKPQGEQ